MPPRTLLSITAALGALWFIAGPLCATMHGQSSPGDKGGSLARHQRVEDKALHENPSDEGSVRALAEELVALPRVYPRLPAVMESVLVDRLVVAELAYIQGTGPGVGEREVATLLNRMAERVAAPPYAKTTPHQVRVLRMHLVLAYPFFMGRGMTIPDMKTGDSIQTVMSPLQAAHVIASMIDQKFLNPDYQMTPEEWEKSQYEKSLKEWPAIQDAVRPGQTRVSKEAKVQLRTNEKRGEIQQSISQGLTSMTWSESWDLLEQALETLRLTR